MKVTLHKQLVHDLLKQDMVIGVHSERMERDSKYSSEVECDFNQFTAEGLALIEANGTDVAKRRLASFQRLKSNPKNVVIGNVKNIPTLIKSLFEDAPRKWLYSDGREDDYAFAWHIQSATYSPATQYSPTHATLTLVGRRHEVLHNRSITIWKEDIVQKSIVQLLDDKGLYLETDELFREYEGHVERYMVFKDEVGVQRIADGTCYAQEHYRVKHYPMKVDGSLTKVVMDETSPEHEQISASDKDRKPDFDFWSQSTDPEEGVMLEVPTHCLVRAFSLRHHRWFDFHASQLSDYVWNDKIRDDLVLPDNDKRLVSLLVEATGKRMNDIISGKSGGVIVLASGPPGTGKTLTAEVTSEILHKALYSVQCSQLGTKEDKIEKTLTATLQRASRWGAVMLIDEADVYVRERGTDIQQNAIVGVFLRTLEYYNGFLFLTTNRATSVDDAILSRLTAHVRYSMPSDAAKAKIVEVQAKAMSIKMTPSATEYLSTLPISGRDIRSILKLAQFVASAEKREISVALLEYCLGYQDVAMGDEE